MAAPDVKAAYNQLKSVLVNGGKAKGSFESILASLSALTDLVESSASSPSRSSVDNLCVFLRKSLIQLYKDFLLDSLQFIAALVNGIHRHKIAHKRHCDLWEKVQKAIISGLIDYLDVISPNDNRQTFETIAHCMYPVLCEHYLSFSESCYKDVGSKLRQEVYLLLQASTLDYPPNQSKLRDPKLLGGARYGWALSRTKEYVTQEVLLELYNHICPPRAMADKYKSFIDSVFDPALFPSHQSLKAIVISIHNANDWDKASTRLVHTLARMDITFPQPVMISNPSISGNCPCPSQVIYADCEGLAYNVEVGDERDSFHIAYKNITKISYSRHSAPTVTFSFEIKFPTNIDGTFQHERQVTLSFDVPQVNRERFLESLRTGGLSSLMGNDARKISLVDGEVSMPFSLTQGPSASFPEKANRVLPQYDCTPSSEALIFSANSPDRNKQASVPQGQSSAEPTLITNKTANKGLTILQSDDGPQQSTPKMTRGFFSSSSPIAKLQD
ncbi:hypothetical protein GYMLUDRAFT_261691, partial [Collybiopsis luxurians FD-317 M1]